MTREYNDKERAVHCSVWMQAASLVVITHYPKHQKKKKGKKKKKKKEEVKRNLAEKSESFAGQHQIRVVCTFSKNKKQKKIMSQRCPANLQGEAMQIDPFSTLSCGFRFQAMFTAQLLRCHVFPKPHRNTNPRCTVKDGEEPHVVTGVRRPQCAPDERVRC